MKTIQIKCSAKTTMKIDDLREFQGNLKNLSEANYLRLKNQILKQGFSFPLFVWESDGSRFLLDGHQRLKVLRKLEDEGYEIPEIPVAIVEASSYKEAKQKLLSAASQYGEVEKQGLYEFLTEADLDPGFLIENMRLPEIDLLEFQKEFYETPAMGDYSEGKELGEDEFKEFKHQCPKCSFEYN